jgi:hypothetical protein
MAERRRVTRHEPITTETRFGDLVAEPLPWRQRNDLGDLVIQTYVNSITAMQGAFRIDEETGKPVGGTFDDKAIDWDGLLSVAYPNTPKEDIEKLDIYELRTSMCSSLEVNDMSHLGYMVDPNFQSPVEENQTESPPSDGTKITSLPDSGSLGTQEKK